MKNIKLILGLSFLLLILMSFTTVREPSKFTTMHKDKKMKVAYFSSGCFWCVEAIYESIIGVDEVISGYAGGFTKNPTYESVSTGKTGHAETVAVYYDPDKVSFKTLVEAFFASHDPTTKNGQYPDFGSQYRSVAFYQTEEEKQVIQKVLNRLNKEVYDGKIVTEVKKIDAFILRKIIIKILRNDTQIIHIYNVYQYQDYIVLKRRFLRF